MKRRLIRFFFQLLALTGCGTMNGAYAQTVADSVSMLAAEIVAGCKDNYQRLRASP